VTRWTEKGLSPDRIVGAAFEVMAESGLDGVNMRQIGARLGVQAPALYWHFRNKAELLGAMAQAIQAEARANAAPAREWRDWLTGFGRSLRQSLTSRRDAATLFAIAQPKGWGDDAAARIAAPLTERGLDIDRALSYQASVISLTLGWASYQANGPMRGMLATMFDFDASFETGLAALVRGFE
jgi:TetR/AcrR family tetracycline transcriptional repressor